MEEHQCQCLTAKGTQCTRLVMPPSLYCWQHKNCKTPSSAKRKVSPKPKPVAARQPVKTPKGKSIQLKTPASPRKPQAQRNLRISSVQKTNPVGRFLTGDPNVDMMVLLQMDDKTLATTCRTDKYANRLCNDENFWRQKVDRLPFKHGPKPADKTWKQAYQWLTDTVTIPFEIRTFAGAMLLNARGQSAKPFVYPQIFNIQLPKSIVDQINKYKGAAEDINSVSLEASIPGLNQIVLELLQQHPEYFMEVDMDLDDPRYFRIKPTLLYSQKAGWINYNPANTYRAMLRYIFDENGKLMSIRIAKL